MNYGATFAGVLAFRGYIIEAIESQTPMSQWPVQIILSMFVSGVDRHRNFSRFFRETRARLLFYVGERMRGQHNRLQSAYVLACMEYAQARFVYDASAPTHHMLLFAKLFQLESENYLMRDNAQSKQIRQQLPQHISRARHSGELPTDPILEAMCQFLQVDTEDTDTAPAHQPKSTNKTRGARKRPKKHAEASTSTHPEAMEVPDIAEASTTPHAEEMDEDPDIVFGSIHISSLIRRNPLLDALVTAMPSIHFHLSDVVEVVAPSAARIDRLTEEFAHVDIRDDNVKLIPDAYDVSQLASALNAAHIAEARGAVVLEEADEVMFEQVVAGYEDIGGEDGDVEMEL
jgi:hypothetical protein